MRHYEEKLSISSQSIDKGKGVIELVENSSEEKLDTVNIVEIGPGSGIMMADIIRVSISSRFRLLFIDSCTVHRKPYEHPN